MMRRPGYLLALAALVVFALASPAVAQNPEADILVSEAILAFEEARYDAAREKLVQALRLDPENLQALYYLGLVHLAQQRPTQAVEALERARTRAPTDLAVLFQLGVAYFALGDYDRAEPLLTRVFERDPRLDGVGYYVGFMRYRKKDYQGALRAFSAGSTRDPALQQLTRLYSGLALAVLGLSERATAEIEAALRAPASQVTGPAERIRDTLLARRDKEQRLRAEVRLGVLYDDNVASNPRPNDDPTIVDLRSRDTRTEGGLAALRLEYAFFRSAPWEATVGYSLLQTYNSLTSFNIRDHLATLGGTWTGALANMPLQLGAQYAFDHLSLRDEPFIVRNTGTAFAALVESPLHLTTAQLRFQGKDFEDEGVTVPEERRDAMNYLAGILHILRFQGDRHLLRFGYQFDVEDAAGRNFSYLGHRLVVGGQYTLPRFDTRLKYDYDVHFRRYDDLHTLLPPGRPNTRERDDTEQTHVVRIEQPLPHSITLALELQAIRGRSNLHIFSFDRNVVSLQMSWNY